MWDRRKNERAHQEGSKDFDPEAIGKALAVVNPDNRLVNILATTCTIAS